MSEIRVLVHASDPIHRAGIGALLDAAPKIRVVDADGGDPDVLVVVEQAVGGPELNTIREIRANATRRPGPRCVVVTDRFDENSMMFAGRCGVVSVVPIACASGASMASVVVRAASGAALLPKRFQTALLQQFDRMRMEVFEPNGLTLSGLADDEINVLRLIAEGLRTDEIATRLSCSESSVKATLYGAIKRLGLTNRTHAVSYAIRTGALI